MLSRTGTKFKWEPPPAFRLFSLQQYPDLMKERIIIALLYLNEPYGSSLEAIKGVFSVSGLRTPQLQGLRVGNIQQQLLWAN